MIIFWIGVITSRECFGTLACINCMLRSLIPAENHLCGFIETVAPWHCRIARRLSAHVQQWNSHVREHLDSCHRNYSHTTVANLTLSISLRASGLYAAARIQEGNTWLGSAEAAKIRADFEQTIVDKARDQWRKRLGACVKAKGANTLTHAVTCDAVHCLNKHTGLTGWRFSH